MRFQLVGLIVGWWIASTSFGQAQTSTMKLLGDFEEGWQAQWVERKVADKETLYEVVDEDSDSVLMATSESSASLLWRPLDIQAGNVGRISWKWKIDNGLSEDTQEKRKIGYDYVARVYVIFEPHAISWKTRALCYVWAANQTVGSSYKNPYSNSVTVNVVQSGNENRDKWISEKRDFIADYRSAFGQEPQMITGVALMVDTDNTKQQAITWFDDLELESGMVKQDVRERPRIIFDGRQ